MEEMEQNFRKGYNAIVRNMTEMVRRLHVYLKYSTVLSKAPHCYHSNYNNNYKT